VNTNTLLIIGGVAVGALLLSRAAEAAKEVPDAVSDAAKDMVESLTGAESESSGARKAREAREAAEKRAAQVGSPQRAAERRSAQETMAREGYVSYMVKLWGDSENAYEHEARQSVLSAAQLSAMIADPATGEAQRVALIAYANGKRLPAPSGLMEPVERFPKSGGGLTVENR